MRSEETKLKSLALRLGADLVGITTRDILADGPPSADPRYLLPSANSVISLAVSLDKDSLQDFICKKSWEPHCHDRKAIAKRLYTIGDALAETLRADGYDAVNVDLNNNYRPEESAADLTEMTEFHPDFSHRYGALAAGIGRLGWSGNLLTREYGARVELGSVLTSAALTPDASIPDEDHPCDKCKMCSRVCPVEMIHPKASMQVTVAGITETLSRKQSNTRCWIGCTGYEGLAPSGTWSNWSPYRLGRPLPGEKEALDALCIRLQKADPQMQGPDNSFSNYRQAVFDPEWFYYTVCGFCRSVCAPRREERLANRKLIINSGTAALKLDGSHVVAEADACEMATPYGLRVVVPRGELTKKPKKIRRWPGQFPLDREVIRYLRREAASSGENCIAD
ncbi:MAG: epoxyqueuosine reductase [Deltaproteobacteria bacterium]|nr:epoxyqueuosine reductase [Deltaproteobacteria bacterium]MBW2041191.1 epoxyqueuosine reductase [Deltaproteobacteria bacterium]MBW2132173.1 epoxyqueuosine reductase [Deltaproteobacteria bacterium]